MSRVDGTRDFEIAIVGGGPAGLSAAIAGGRMNRRTVCFETGTPRTSQAPRYYNVLGFPEGISGEVLLGRGREQARRWCTELHEAKVSSVERVTKRNRDVFALETSTGGFRARGLILATGMDDVQPSCGNLYGQPGVHYCVVCDGYEVRGERVAVVGRGEGAFNMIRSLRDFTEDLHLLLDGAPPQLGEEQLRLLDEWGVRVEPGRLCRHESASDESRLWIDRASAAAGDEGASETSQIEERYPHVFIALGCRPRTRLAAQMGCRLDGNGFIVTDACQATSIPLVYAAGDCDGGYKQVTQAMAEGERAALELSRRLRESAGPALGATEPNVAAVGEGPADEFEVEGTTAHLPAARSSSD
jgi:thioredoxin reductase (NADPH)